MTTGTLYSFTDTNIEKRSVSDSIYMIDWTEAPALNILGFSSANLKKFNLVNWPNRKAELLEDTMPTRASTLAEALDGSETDWDVATGTGQYFRTGDVVGVFNSSGAVAEKAIVDYVTTDTITVKARGYGTTSATTHDSGSTIKILTRAMPENSLYTLGYTTTTSNVVNYSQILSEAVAVSNTTLAISKYGIDDMLDYQVTKLFADGGSAGVLAQALEDTFYYGEAVERSASNEGTMGGFKSFVTTNVTNMNGDPVTREHIHTKLRQIRTAGGRCDYLMTGAWGVEKITQMYEGTIETTRDEKLGGSEITQIMTPHGKVKIAYNYRCPESEWYFINSDKCGWLPVRDFMRNEVMTQRDGKAVDVVGEFTFMVCNEKSHGYLHGASTTE